MKHGFRIAASGLLVLVASCATGSTAGDRMFDHFSRASAVQSALIVGDLDGARRPAAWLADHDVVASASLGDRGWLDALGTAAAEIRDAGSVDEAADATGRLAESCAGCHTSSNSGPRFRSAGDPPTGDDRATHMIRNLWAMDRMWEGLIGASSATWQAGARAIADEDPETFPGGSAVSALARAVHEQATRAERTPRGNRAAVYADLMKTCAGCHTLVGAGAD
jgi:mono/diheme cytochrome c family protein